ncbi:AAA family ATPase [Candidatus Leptofilum sp.]|uniref:AAA family ATPase n=1 Tax=Candidatus Leptofilum sp. TaxID=3241576 RepID=UPI003B5CA885
MSNLPRDPWQDVTTFNGFPADHVISALQKEIRRGNSENAALLAYEMVLTSPALEDYLWQRLMIISVEDIGLGDPQAPVLINALVQMLARFDRSVAERKLFAIHAVRYLCAAQKDRSSDEMINWMIHGVAAGTLRPTIPDYALDMHTGDGQKMGRGKAHFWAEGAKVAPELPNRDTTYREYITKLLNEGAWD